LLHLAATASAQLTFYRHAQIPLPGQDADMSVPGWLAGGFAILMVVTAVYCAARLAISRRSGRSTERDADALHVLMGVAMAGMLEPRLTPIPVTAWRVVFAAAAVWFGWQATRPGRRARAARCAYPAAHAGECVAMVYMLLPIGSWPVGRGPAMAMAMPGMNQGTTAGNPALTLLLALFMLGYVLWAIDRLTHLPRTPAVGGAVLAPRLAASYKVGMAVTMGYMLITML
jgi:hypothetical protein